MHLGVVNPHLSPIMGWFENRERERKRKRGRVWERGREGDLEEEWGERECTNLCEVNDAVMMLCTYNWKNTVPARRI